MATSLKTGFAQISLAAQKIWVAQNLGGLQPPSPYAYRHKSYSIIAFTIFTTVCKWLLAKHILTKFWGFQRCQKKLSSLIKNRLRAVPFFSYSPSRAERKKQAARKLAARKPCHQLPRGQLSHGLFFSLRSQRTIRKNQDCS